MTGTRIPSSTRSPTRAGRKNAQSEEGVAAEFDGKNGWFWHNRTSKPMKITLEVEVEHNIEEAI